MGLDKQRQRTDSIPGRESNVYKGVELWRDLLWAQNSVWLEGEAQGWVNDKKEAGERGSDWIVRGLMFPKKQWSFHISGIVHGGVR